MKATHLALLVALSLPLAACFDSDHPPPGADLAKQDKAAPATTLSAEVKAPLDKAAAVNDMIDAQDAAQRKAMDEQGR